MSFGLSGAHRSGKTTLARALSEQMQIPFFETSTSKLLAEKGINAVGDLPLLQRIEAQEYLIEKHWELTQALPRPFISDRTPLDMIAYTLGEVTMHNTDLQTAQRIQRYVERCLWVANHTYSGILVLRPLPFYEKDDTKPPENPGYQTMIQMIVEGALEQLEYTNQITLYDSDHAERLKDAVEFIGETLTEIAAIKAKASIH